MSSRGNAAERCAAMLEDLETMWGTLRDEWAQMAKDWRDYSGTAVNALAEKLESVRAQMGVALDALRAYELELLRRDNPGAAKAAREVVGSRIDGVELGFNVVFASVWEEQHRRRARAAVRR